MKTLSLSTFFVLSIPCISLLHSPSSLATPNSFIQLVQSTPTETKLANPTLSQAKEVWIEMIRGAQNSIDLEQFYIASKPGEALEPVLHELKQATKRGVKLRVIFSNALIKEDPEALDFIKSLPHTTVRICNYSKLTGGIQHAKFWIIDGKEIFVGSQNFDWRALSQIHETGVRIHNPTLAKQLLDIFELDWNFAETGKYPPPSTATTHTVQPLPALELVGSPAAFLPLNTRPALPALLDLLKSAQKSVRIQLLDYSPVSGKTEFWPEIDNALRAAAIRGIKVELMVSHWNTDEPAVSHLKSLSLIPNIEVRVVTIPEHSSGFIPYARVIHSKYLLIDDQVLWLGTSNWSKSYFYTCRNIELIFRNPNLNKQGQEIFQTLWNSSFAEKIDPLKKYPKPQKGAK